MKKTTRLHELQQMFRRHRGACIAGMVLALVAVAGMLWWRTGRETGLHVVAQFKTADYPVAVTGTADNGYVLTAGGQIFTVPQWKNQQNGVTLDDEPTSFRLSTSGKYLLVMGRRLTLLDSALTQKWSRRTTTPSVVEQALFTTSGQIAAVYSFLEDQSRQFVLYDLRGTYMSGYRVPDFGRGSQVALARNGMLVVTLSGGTMYTITPEGKIIAKFSVPNDGTMGGFTSVVNESGTRILAGYTFATSGTVTTLSRYLFDQAGTQLATLSTSSANSGIRALGDRFLLYGRSTELINDDGKIILSASKLNFKTVDASLLEDYCSLLFTEETASESTVCFLGVYSVATGTLAYQWSTAESETPRIFQLPQAHTALALAGGFLVLAP